MFIFVIGSLSQDRMVVYERFFNGKKLSKMPVNGHLQYATAIAYGVKLKKINY